MAQLTQTEYVEVDGTPLATPAWEVEDLSPLWDAPEIRGGDLVVPYRRGVIPFRRNPAGKPVDLPLAIFGDADPDGAEHATPRVGLQLNRDTFMRDVWRPPQVGTIDGTRTLRYHLPDGSVRSGPCTVSGGLRPTPVGPSTLRVSLALNLTDGGLRDEDPVDVTSDPVGAGLDDLLVVPNPGTDYQDRIVYTLTGSASSVRIINQTVSEDVWLEIGADLASGDVELDTGTFTATRGGTLNVVGTVSHSGFERWLPLIPGDNALRIEPTGGTATLQAVHNPFYL